MSAVDAPADVGRDLAAYLQLLTARNHGSGWLEIRYRTRRGMRSLFYPARSRRRSLHELVRNVSAYADVYIGCSLRRVRRGDKAALGEAWVLWVEFDTPAAGAALDAFACPPTMTVASGTPGHLHAYWQLTRPVRSEVLEDANRRLAHALGGDPVCFDAGRILRPPGTLNHKHQPPRAVRLQDHQPLLRHRLKALLAELPELPAAPPATEPSPTRRDDALLSIAPDVYVPELVGAPLGRNRKVRCPMHTDRTPSLHAFPSAEQGWFCFGCRRGGSLYDLAAAMWGLEARGSDFVELRQRLTARFL